MNRPIITLLAILTGLMLLALFFGCTQASAESTSSANTQPSPIVSTSTNSITFSENPFSGTCPRGLSNDPFPGVCGSYVDNTNDGICDRSQ